jgi:hypothetical protein
VAAVDPPGQPAAAYHRTRRPELCHRLYALYERIHLPYDREGQRTGALRFGDIRVMALAGALCHQLRAVAAFTNKTLRALVAAHRPASTARAG